VRGRPHTDGVPWSKTETVKCRRRSKFDDGNLSPGFRNLVELADVSANAAYLDARVFPAARPS
jgi:hypothetical protein